jgi:GNAT superfamily N-acetyltransferase
MTSLTSHQIRILQHWADWFGCEREALMEPGHRLHPHERYEGLDGVFVWYLGQHVCIECAPEMEGRVRVALAERGQDRPVDGQVFRRLWATDRPGAALLERQDVLYLQADDLRTWEGPADVYTRRLEPASVSDRRAFEDFLKSCTEDDQEEAAMDLDDEAIMGAFEGSVVVSSASVYERTGFLDFGSLTQASHRRRGLGKAVVSQLSSWCLQRGFIPQYRCEDTNQASLALAESVGFRRHFIQESVWPPAAEERETAPRPAPQQRPRELEA